MMKIAFVSQPINSFSIPPSGSLTVWTYEVARRLARSCQVVVYAKARGLRKKVECVDDVIYRRIPVILDILWLRLFKRLAGFRHVKRPLFASSSYYLGYALQVANDLRKLQCDVVHVLNFSQLVPIIRAFNPKIKIVLNMRCDWLTQLDSTMIERRLNQVDLIIGCSEYITERIRRTFPRFASRCQTVHNGCDVNYFFPENGCNDGKEKCAKRLLFVGRVSPEKGVHVLLEAFKQVVKRFPQAQLEIVGPVGAAPLEFIVALSDDPKVSALASFYPGDYFSHLQDRLSNAISRQISFRESVPNHELLKYYRNAEVFIFPSIWDEPFGIPPVEAMAAGVPVIATRAGGIWETVEDGKTGILVEPDNLDALAEAIQRLLENEERRNAMGKAGRKRAVELFSYERVVENLLRQYERI